MAKREKTTIDGSQFSSEEKNKALEAARLQIEKQYGKGALMQLNDENRNIQIGSIGSGSILLDEALGIGGYPKGRVVEVYGPESSGKTTLALHAIAEAQRAGGIAAFIDAEHALDPVYAKNLGVNTEELWVSQPDNGEQALEIAESLVRSGAVDLIVIDSVAALTPQAEIEGEMGDSHVGLQARLMSQALRKLTGSINRSGTCIIFINQIRMKIGVMFGNPETTTGGKALKFYSSVRLEVRRIETISKGADDAIGNKVRVKVVKNKVAPPFRKCEMEIMFGKGISASGSLLDGAVKYDIIKKAGSWYSYGEDRIGQGRENAKEYLESNPDLYAEIDAKLREVIFPKPSDAIKDAETDKDTTAKSGLKDKAAAQTAESPLEVSDDELF
ncbi:recombinase RecA [Spirochaeta africana]|uniref:Protein RecA n=1 Tax=Spirochaeta africana (strain ATCC 700263 / DSM 8902 / Z-7692) TaxID=889378 RepID=H9UJ87_SPIAZ|nr:recombinase RecA [Spirochaeta africana]AFG37580.1 protein RecA [Spirochaeta africana DSM 8902]